MERRNKFHDALLKLYHPSPPMPESHNSQASPAAEEEPVKVAHIDIQSDADPAESEELEKEGCDSGSEKLARSRRKRIGRRKLKEASSTRRKTIGPLLPSGYKDPKEEAFQGEK